MVNSKWEATGKAMDSSHKWADTDSLRWAATDNSHKWVTDSSHKWEDTVSLRWATDSSRKWEVMVNNLKWAMVKDTASSLNTVREATDSKAAGDDDLYSMKFHQSITITPHHSSPSSIEID
jgi:hypothetical protein